MRGSDIPNAFIGSDPPPRAGVTQPPTAEILSHLLKWIELPKSGRIQNFPLLLTSGVDEVNWFRRDEAIILIYFFKC